MGKISPFTVRKLNSTFSNIFSKCNFLPVKPTLFYDPNMAAISLAFIALASTLTALLSGFLGMAGGIILLAILTVLLPFPLVVPIHGAAQLFSNTFRVFLLRQYVHRKILFFFFAGAPFGTLISIKIIKSVKNPEIFLIGVALVIFYALFKPKKLPTFSIPPWGFLFVGIFTGVMGPLIGATGPFQALFYLRNDLKKEQIVATKSATQVVIHFLKIPAFIHLSFDYKEHGKLILLLAVTGLIGTKIGVKLLGKIKENYFRFLYRTALFLSALRILYKTLFLNPL